MPPRFAHTQRWGGAATLISPSRALRFLRFASSMLYLFSVLCAARRKRVLCERSRNLLSHPAVVSHPRWPTLNSSHLPGLARRQPAPHAYPLEPLKVPAHQHDLLSTTPNPFRFRRHHIASSDAHPELKAPVPDIRAGSHIHFAPPSATPGLPSRSLRCAKLRPF
jgi:hypothetical protein